MKVVCGCGKTIRRIDNGKDHVITGMCQACVENDGEFIRDPEEERRQLDHVAYERSIKNVKPTRRKRT